METSVRGPLKWAGDLDVIEATDAQTLDQQQQHGK